MSQAVSIIFLLIGALLTMIISWSEFQKPKRWGFKSILIIVFFAFVSVGTWDTCNRYSDSNHDRKEVVNTVKKTDTTIGLKIDTATRTVVSNSDNNRDSIIKSLPKIAKIFYPVNRENSKKEPSPKNDTDKRSKYDLKNSTFNAPTQIGDGNTQNNNFGPKPRIITKQTLNSFFIKYPDKNIKIIFDFINVPNDEGLSVKQQIIQILKSEGYWNIDETYYSEGVLPDPGPIVNVFIRVGKKNIEFEIGSLR